LVKEHMQTGRLTDCQTESLVAQKCSVCIYSVGKGAYADSEVDLLTGRESCSEETERDLHIL
jgi:hypothetical protein